jgi:flagellar protein FliL
MSEAKETPATAEAAPAKKKKGKSKLLLIILPVFVLLMGGGAGAWWYFNQSPAEQSDDDLPPTAGMASLESFIANLADPGGRKYVRATVLVLVPDAAKAKHFEEDKLTLSRVRSAVLELLATKTSAELGTPDGRAALKKAIAETVTKIGKIDVRDVLFEELIVQ